MGGRGGGSRQGITFDKKPQRDTFLTVSKQD